MKNFKILSILLSLFVAVGFTSCGNDDETSEVTGYNDFYTEVKVSGGGLSASEQHELETDLNADGLYLETMKKNEAVSYFEDFIEVLTYEFYDGLSWVEGTLELKFTLKTTKGVKVDSKTIYVTNKKSWSKVPQVRVP